MNSIFALLAEEIPCSSMSWVIFAFVLAGGQVFAVSYFVELCLTLIVRSVVKIWKHELTFFPTSWWSYLALAGLALIPSLVVCYILWVENM